MSVQVKICGITRVEDALMCVNEGADAIGLNFWTGSKRCCDSHTANQIVQAVRGKIMCVAVFVNYPVKDIIQLRDDFAFDCVQLHGNESNNELRALLPHAYKAIGVRDSNDIEAARSFDGKFVMLDTKIDTQFGGSGLTFDWTLAIGLAQERSIILAGGLNELNVAHAVQTVRPYCVDVASGVESVPGIKDLNKVRRFIRAAKGA